MRTCKSAAPTRSIVPRWVVVAALLAGFLGSGFGAWGKSAWPALADVSLAETSGTATPRSELLKRMGVSEWQARGWRGQGVKIAVLDSGFSGYKAHLGAALPRTVRVRSFRYDGNLEAKDSQHGILCAEVIHALAPDAELLFANWEPERPDQFLAAARWARQQGARVLTCSIIMPTWSDCEGHGRVHDALTSLLATPDEKSDALFFASAGNTAQRHWSGAFHEGKDGYHVWTDDEGNESAENAIHPWGTERVSVELCSSADSRFELSVYDSTARKEIGRSVSGDVGGSASAVVAFVPESGHDYCARVRRMRLKSGAFHLVVLGGALTHSASRGSIPFPGDGQEVIAVGAVDGTNRRLAYSSCGPQGDVVKPDFVATVPFPSSWRSRPFSGTSAAAPQAGALAALLWSNHPQWSASRIRTRLEQVAAPCAGNPGRWEIGHGLLRLPSPTAETEKSR